MPNDSHILEVAIFTVKKEFLKDIKMIREQVYETIQQFPGLISIEAYYPVNDSETYVDIVKWDSLENAMAAAKLFESGDERVMPMMQAIEEVKFMGHFKH